MATLTAGITASTTEIPTDATSPGFYQLGSEAIRLLHPLHGRNLGKWKADRSIAGTTAASHSNGATLTAYDPAAPASGGGSGLGNPVTEQLVVQPASGDEDYMVFIQTPVDYEQGFGEVLQIQNSAGTTIWGLNVFGQVTQTAINPELLMNVEGGGALRVSAAGDGGPIFLQAESATRVVFRVGASGVIITGANAAPPDADLSAGHMALWFDATNGAAKLKIKGKSANGTVVNGEVALS